MAGVNQKQAVPGQRGQTTQEAGEKRSEKQGEVAKKAGRDIIFDYLASAGVKRMFGVPGTNEVPIIDGTDPRAGYGIEYVQCLHENIAMGAAMGYARMAGVPGVAELHVTPGIAHAVGNLYNAYKSTIPVVLLCGQQHSNLLIQEPLLASDLVRIAEQYTKWAYEVRGPDEIGMAMQRALKTALAPPMGPVFLSIPWQFLIEDGVDPDRGQFTRVARNFAGDPAEVDSAAKVLAAAKNPLIIVGDGVGAAGAWEEVADLASAIGAPVYMESLSSFLNYPSNDPLYQGELPQIQEKLRELFQNQQTDVAFLCGYNAQAQLVVFNWDKGPVIPWNIKQVYLHNDPWQIGKNHCADAAVLGDIKTTLPKLTAKTKELLDTDQARKQVAQRAEKHQKARENARQKIQTEIDTARKAEQGNENKGQIPTPLVVDTLRNVAKAENVALRLANEAVSDIPFFQNGLDLDAPTSYLAAEGGSLGYSMPASLGMASAIKERSGGAAKDGHTPVVVNAVGDGSALFYLNTWWSAKRHELPILYLVMNNKQYKTLRIGLRNVESSYEWHPTGTAEYLKLEGTPELDFVKFADGFGIEGTRVTTSTELAAALKTGFSKVKAGHPYLVEAMTDRALPPVSPDGQVTSSSTASSEATQQPMSNALQGGFGGHFDWYQGPA